MKLTHVPLLRIQRDLYRLPRGPDRFKAYLATLLTSDRSDLALPLSAMNPMGKDHLPPFLDAALALDAEGFAARAVADALPDLAVAAGDLRLGLVVADDLLGGWTNR